MKTTMASAALLLVLALALVSSPLTAEAQKKKKEKEEIKGVPATCAGICDGRPGVDYVVCKDSCELNEKANLVEFAKIQCEEKCSEKKGVTKQQTAVCQAQCGKEYQVKADELTAACNKVCALEKNPTLQQGCKWGCTPRG